jgi:xylulokinase
MTVVLGIDLGLSGARAAIVDDRGRILGRGRAPMRASAPGRVRAEDWHACIATSVRAAQAETSHPIEAIGIGALGPCPVLLDDSGAALGEVPLFSTDSSAEAERQTMLRAHGLSPESIGPDHVLPRLRHWQKTEPMTMARARLVVDAAGYLVTWLTGRPVMDPATRHDHVAEGFVPVLPLPDILPAMAIAGVLTPSAACALGLAPGVPVTTGGYDSYIDLLGAGVRSDGDAGLLLGSTMVLGCVRNRAPDPRALAAAGLRATPYIGDAVFAGGWTSSSGSLIDWAQSTVGRASCAPVSAPAGHGLLALPSFAGERAPIWDPLARGAIVGLSLATSPEDIATALRESVALSALDISDRLATSLGPVETFRGAGGGFNNGAWARDTVDALGVPIEVASHAGEALGPAMLALAALGRPTEPAIAQTLRPDARRHAGYRALLESYRQLYPALKETLHKLGRLASEEEMK